MNLGIVFFILVVASGLGALGYRRINLPRKSGLEGIDDPQVAEAYDRISRWPQFRLLRRMFTEKLVRYNPEGLLVDIGCGPGRLTILVAQKLPHLHVIGVDAANEMTQVGTSLASSTGLSERVEFRQGDVSNLPIPDGAVDYAISTLSLHHWSNPDRGLAEIYRVLKPGGQILLFDFRRDARSFFYWLLNFAQAVVVPAALRRVNEPLNSLLSSYTPAELQDLFARLPFQKWKVEGGVFWLFVWARKVSPETA